MLLVKAVRAITVENCSCAAYPSTNPPAFVCDHYQYDSEIQSFLDTITLHCGVTPTTNS